MNNFLSDVGAELMLDFRIGSYISYLICIRNRNRQSSLHKLHRYGSENKDPWQKNLLFSYKSSLDHQQRFLPRDLCRILKLILESSCQVVINIFFYQGGKVFNVLSFGPNEKIGKINIFISLISDKRVF